MPTTTSVLWCVALLWRHVAAAGSGFRADQVDRRIPSRNDTTTALISASQAKSILPETTTSSLDPDGLAYSTIGSSSYAVPDSTRTSMTEYESAAPSNTEDADSDPFVSISDLGRITTLTRPTLQLPSPANSNSEVSTTPAITSSLYISNPSHTALPSATIPKPFFNTASIPSKWNSTTNVTAPPPPPVTTFTIPSPTSITVYPNTSASECSSSIGQPITVTSYSIVYTSTTTWAEDPSDYTPPFPTINTPGPCTPKSSPTGLTTFTTTDNAPNLVSSSGAQAVPALHFATIIYVTTDKNPAVVFPSLTLPDYGGSPASDSNNHKTVSGDSAVTTPEYGMVMSSVEDHKAAATPAPAPISVPASAQDLGSELDSAPVTVVVDPGEVQLNDQTFTDNPEQKTSTVVVGTDTFVIDPSKVVGASATITRPPNVGGVLVAVPATTTIEGIEVVYGSSVATIDGTVYEVGPTPVSVVVKGQPIVLGAGAIAFPSQTLNVNTGPGATETGVLGGELITAIGSDVVVIEGTTTTYGADPSTVTEVVDGDTILIGPSGVIVHGKTLGGPTAASIATTFEMVGGATITQLGKTAVVIGGVTYSVGAGTTATTTVIDGETITIGPNGVSISTLTLGAPYASTTTIGASQGTNAAMRVPTATGSAENSGPVTRPDRGFCLMISCIATGGALLGSLIFWV